MFLRVLGIFVALGDFLKVLLGIGDCVSEFQPGWRFSHHVAITFY